MDSLTSKLGRGAGLFALLLAAPFASLEAQPVIYGNNASFGPDIVQRIDLTTGALIQSYTPSGGNGRGVVVVGDIIYSTQVGDSNIYETSVSTGLSLGVIPTTLASMSTIAYDGSSFWTSDYSGTNRAFQVDFSGNVIKTITLSLADQYMDGMEWFDGKLIANRGDAQGPYDIYDLNGNVLQADFIHPLVSSTGIAFDGTNFYTSNIFNSSLSVWDGTTGAYIRDIQLTGGSFLIEDLSVDYAGRHDINPVPEPSTYGIMGAIALSGIAFFRRRRLAIPA